MSTSTRLLAIACIAGGMPVAALAQYYVDLQLVATGPGTCGSAGVSVPVIGAVTLNLPDTPNNVFETRLLRGGRRVFESKTIAGPFPQVTANDGTIGFSSPSDTSPPYTLIVTDFPAQDGEIIGSGTRVTADCSVDGVATVTFNDGIPAPVAKAMAVPALPRMWLAVLAALLALAAAVAIRTSRRR